MMDIAVDVARDMARHVDAGSSSDEIDAAMLKAFPTATLRTCSERTKLSTETLFPKPDKPKSQGAMASQQTHADRVARSLKRLGFHLSRTGQTFKVVNKACELTVGSGPVMTLAEIERWIGDHIRQA